MVKVSVIIPILNEEKNIKVCVDGVRQCNANWEIIVVDGGSRDRSVAVAESTGVIVCRSEKGRGTQFNAGAEIANGEVMLFLHVDSRLPQNADEQIQAAFADAAVHIATFNMRFDDAHWMLNFYSFFTRFDSLLTSFGDQGIVVRKTFFEKLEGFPDWPLFEDVHLLKMARRQTKVHILDGPVTTSARKFMERGLVRQQLFNGYLIWKYFCGVSPQRLYQQYYDEKKK